MDKINRLSSKAILIAEENIDTDQIIPARFLKVTNRLGFGKNLFADWRYLKDGSPNKKFALNKGDGFERILVAGKNFGCGSSREHAAWAIYDYGFRVVISSFFADIFKNNALNNGIVPVQVTASELKELTSILQTHPETEIQLDLEKQKVWIDGSSFEAKFEISPYKKECLQNAYDDIDYLLNELPAIEKFELCE